MRKPKQSILQYRTINGIRYNCYTSNPNCFDEIKKQCKSKGIKLRIECTIVEAYSEEQIQF